MRLNKKAVSPVIAVMLLVAVAVAAVGAYFIWYKSFHAGTQKQVEEQTGTIGSKLRITNITNDNVTFYITLKNATECDLVTGTPGDYESNVVIAIRDETGDAVGDESMLVTEGGSGNYAKFTSGNIESDEEGQIEVHLDTKIMPGRTYTIILTAAGRTTVEKYTAI